MRVPLGVKVAPGGRFSALSDVMALPSGSLAETVKLRREPSMPVRFAGAVTIGARSTLVTETAVLVEPLSALVARNVTL